MFATTLEREDNVRKYSTTTARSRWKSPTRIYWLSLRLFLFVKNKSPINDPKRSGEEDLLYQQKAATSLLIFFQQQWDFFYAVVLLQGCSWGISPKVFFVLVSPLDISFRYQNAPKTFRFYLIKQHF